MRRVAGALRTRLGGLLAVVLLLVSVVGARPAFAATAVVESIDVRAGSRLTVFGTGFEPGEFVTSWASSTRGAVYATEFGRADGAGNVTLSITIKRFWEPGWWAVTLHGFRSQRQAIATYRVEAAPPDGVLDVEPTVVRRGNRINFHGAGFLPDEGIQVWATRPDGSARAFPTQIIRRGSSANFHFEVPADAPPGTWYMTAYGLQSERLMIVTFVVTL
jgi:hypothetical protein